VGNLRRDGLHKLTTRPAREHGTVVVEDLNVAGIPPNRRLARHITDAGFTELRRQLAYKTTCNGGRLPRPTAAQADRWHPSSKTCSGRGAAKTKLAPSERTHECTAYGTVPDHDLNTTRNLAALPTECDTAGNRSAAGRGADRKTHFGGLVAVKRQPGTAPAGKTGTAAPQGAAA
jgi:putative transposase